jgi:iron(III) transport system ATP-binding protein
LNTQPNTDPEPLPNTLTLERISHRYGNLCAVDDVNLTVAAGEIVCLVGPSGCGKTTLLRLAAGLEPLQQGAVRIGGEIVDGGTRHVPPERRRVGLVFQDYALFPHLDVRDNIGFGLTGLAAAARRERVAQALSRIEMTPYAATYPHALSGGQQQRVALARAVVTQPRVVLLDEPFSGLDARLRDLVRDDATQILRETGVATLMVTHDPEEAMYVADRIAVMNAGRLHQVATPSDIYSRPVDAFVAGFFGDANRLDGSVGQDGITVPFAGLAAMLERQISSVTLGNPSQTISVLIRQEAVRLDAPAADGCPVSVVASRYLGRASLVDVVPADAGSAAAVRLRARVPGRFLPPAGTPFALSLRSDGVFVFPG